METSTFPGSSPVMTVKDWVLTMLVLAIPIVNIIMLFVWAFGSDPNLTRKNFAKAYLILIVILFVVAMIFGALFGTAIFMGSQSGNWD